MTARPPNLLLIMADQLAASSLPCYSHPLVKAPNIAALAERGAVFDAAYCNSPICAPSRFSMLTGRLPTRIGAFDNASEFPAALPTLMHYLRAAGYLTVLAGKMHFIGPDQLHGYKERLITDIYPADFSWTPNWRAGPTDRPSGISMNNVREAGVCVRSLQMDYDDEVESLAIQKLYDLARLPDCPPFFLTVSFSHPHPPFTIDAAHWDLYEHQSVPMPTVQPIPFSQRDRQSQWLHVSHGADRRPVSDEQVRNARHAYYGMASYVDDKVGRLVRTLQACGMYDETIIVFTSDHGEMLGERGMWYKQTFFEPSSRVPLIFHAPSRFPAQRVAQPVSLLDLLPTLTDLAHATPRQWVDPLDGASLAQALYLRTAPESRDIVCEYTDMGVCAPCRMIRRGSYKYVYVHREAPQLFDVLKDPHELENLAGRPECVDIEHELKAAILSSWDPDRVEEEVLASQRRRLFIKQATDGTGAPVDWNYHARPDDAVRFVRAGGAAGAKARARFPFVPPLPDA
ncbi:MAG: choline-sulfatase [Betaproteobacteria bacterium]|nr:MAG: choline-sulfatase [Betaproteobacteria bacterium]